MRKIDPRITSAVAAACIRHRRGMQIRWDEVLIHDPKGRPRVKVTLTGGTARRPSLIDRLLTKVGRPFKTGEYFYAFSVPAALFDAEVTVSAPNEPATRPGTEEERIAHARAIIMQNVSLGIADIRARLERAS